MDLSKLVFLFPPSTKLITRLKCVLNCLVCGGDGSKNIRVNALSEFLEQRPGISWLWRFSRFYSVLPATCYLDQIKAFVFRQSLIILLETFENFQYRGADKSLARPDWKNNWKVAIFLPTRRLLLPRRPDWTDKLLNFFFWVACKFGRCSLFPSWSG